MNKRKIPENEILIQHVKEGLNGDDIAGKYGVTRNHVLKSLKPLGIKL